MRQAIARTKAVVAFVFGEDNYGAYCSRTNTQYVLAGGGGGPNRVQFPIGPDYTFKDAIEGHYYYCPVEGNAAPGYLLEFTPEEWAERFTDLAWMGAVVPS